VSGRHGRCLFCSVDGVKGDEAVVVLPGDDKTTGTSLQEAGLPSGLAFVLLRYREERTRHVIQVRAPREGEECIVG